MNIIKIIAPLSGPAVGANASKRFPFWWLDYIFTNPTDIHVADSVLHIFETRENIENFNKKALYIFIRERTGLATTNITRVIKTLKHIYEQKFKEYEQTDFVKLPF